MINWEVGKAYRTRSGLRVVLEEVDLKSSFPLHVRYTTGATDWVTLQGRSSLISSSHPGDIVGEWDEPKRAVLVGTEEGSECRRDGCEGKIGFHHECQCSVSRAPCWQCENAKLTCTMCEWEEPKTDPFAYKSPPPNKTYTMDEYAAYQRALNEILGDLSAARDNKPDDRRPFKMFRNPNYKRDVAAANLALYRHKHEIWPHVVADRAADKPESNRDKRPWYERV